MKYSIKENTTVKPLTINDALFIFQCRNNYFQKNIFLIQNKKLKYNEHKIWLKNFIKNKINKGWIILNKKKKIGYLLLKKLGIFYEITIILDKKFTNQGIGQVAYQKAIKKLKNNNLIIANVLKKNLKSLNYFEKMNFIKIGLERNKVILAKLEMLKTKNNFSYINKIEKIRGKNNSNWMDLLKLAFSLNRNETINIMRSIYSKDEEISKSFERYDY